MKTHEAQDEGDITRIADFCLDSRDNLYWAMHDCYSTTYPNYTPFQAWRAGFREGVKMCLNRGAVPTVDEFKESVAKRNMNNLTVWHNVGSDVNNGHHAMLGAQYGTYLTMLTDWNHLGVQWFDNYPELYEDFITNKFNDHFLVEATAKTLSAILGGTDLIYLEFDEITEEIRPENLAHIYHIFTLESGIGEVIDPVAGSFYLDDLTTKIANQIWGQLKS
jgi:hypothetical protein